MTVDLFSHCAIVVRNGRRVEWSQTESFAQAIPAYAEGCDGSFGRSLQHHRCARAQQTQTPERHPAETPQPLCAENPLLETDG